MGLLDLCPCVQRYAGASCCNVRGMNGAIVSVALRPAGDYRAVIGLAAQLNRDSVSVEFWHVQGPLEAGAQEFLFIPHDAVTLDDAKPVTLDWPGLPVSEVERQGLASGARATLPIVNADE